MEAIANAETSLITGNKKKPPPLSEIRHRSANEGPRPDINNEFTLFLFAA
jgi:hypothetical protein